MSPSAYSGTAGSPEAKAAYMAKSLGSKAVSNSESISKIDIIDIRRDAVEINLKEDVLTSLRPESGPKQLPTLLLYNERGLQLFEEVSLRQPSSQCRYVLTRKKITYLDEYYLTNAEINVLQKSADSIAKAIPSDSMVVELGSGLVTVSGPCHFLATNNQQ
jgi:uncharacterized SAM-dependent methyltransferase